MMPNATMKNIQKQIEHLKGKEVVFTEKHGSKRIRFKAILEDLYNEHGLIRLDRDIHNYETYSFNYIHIFMGEGYLKEWDRELDPEILMNEF